MLSAIILAFDAQGRPPRRDAVTRTLASLVDACVQGLVADAALAGPPGCDLQAIADDAGCALVEATSAAPALARALDLTRRDDALLLLAGFAVERGFVDEVNDARAYGDRNRALVLRAAPQSLLTRLAPGLAPAAGLIAPKRALAGADGDLSRMARRLKAATLTSRGRPVITG